MAKNSIKQIMEQISDINKAIERVLEDNNYYEEELCIEMNKKDENDLFMYDQLSVILNKLCEVSCRISYLERPVEHIGTLEKNYRERYEIDGKEITSGSVIEYLENDGWHNYYDENSEEVNVKYWKKSSVEHNGTDYYIVGRENKKMDGIKARIRK